MKTAHSLSDLNKKAVRFWVQLEDYFTLGYVVDDRVSNDRKDMYYYIFYTYDYALKEGNS